MKSLSTSMSSIIKPDTRVLPPGPGRHLSDERHDVHPRLPQGLRQLGGGRQRGLVVRGRAAVLPQVRGQQAAKGHGPGLPRDRRPAHGRAVPVPSAAELQLG